MIVKQRARLVRQIFFLLACLPMLGCAHLQTKNPEQALLERAQIYWAARESRDLHTVYKMESAGLPGGWLTPYNASSIGAGIFISNARVDDIKVEGEKGIVTVSADIRIATMVNTGMGTFRSTLPDTWVRIDGEWYHETKKPVSLGKLSQERKKERLKRLKDQGKQEPSGTSTD
jgi:hypothetical protein